MKKNGEDIFPKQTQRLRNLGIITKYIIQIFFPKLALYPNHSEDRGIGKVLKETLGNNGHGKPIKISDIEQPIVFIPAYDTLSRNTTWFASNRNDWVKDIELWKICVSSASAPTFFPPYQLPYNKQELPHIDGGVSTNNPSLSAIAHVLPDKEINLENIAVLSIGTGISTKRFHSQEIEKWGLAQWIANLPNIFMDPGAENSQEICGQILESVKNKRVNYLRLNFILNKQLKGAFVEGELRDSLERPYNEYLMHKYKEKYQKECPDDPDIQELYEKEWLKKEEEWVNKLEKKYSTKLSLKEDIDNPEICSDLKEAAEIYIKYGEIRNGSIKKNIQEQIRQFIIDNPPDSQGNS